jgi:hypothetical protein
MPSIYNSHRKYKDPLHKVPVPKELSRRNNKYSVTWNTFSAIQMIACCSSAKSERRVLRIECEVFTEAVFELALENW